MNRLLPGDAVVRGTVVQSFQGVSTGLYASDTWRATSRLTFNLGVVFDRYRSYLPEQTGPPVGPFNPTQASFPAVNNLITAIKLSFGLV